MQNSRSAASQYSFEQSDGFIKQKGEQEENRNIQASASSAASCDKTESAFYSLWPGLSGTKYAIAASDGYPSQTIRQLTQRICQMSAGLTQQMTTRPGAHFTGDAGCFRVWAPERKRVRLVFVEPNGRQRREIDLHRDPDGFFNAQVRDVRNGDLYLYRVDDDPKLYPDPASHFQPQGVHGPSQVVDHRRFRWSDDCWPGVTLLGQVLYELHIGTFTEEGTWIAAASKLRHLRDLGVTLIEVMPIGAFPGKFGWGYDGVYWYAPTELYGTPDQFRGFVNEAHRLGIGVILDVVYNHFGPSGNYTAVFSPYYHSKEHETEWGRAINFDGRHAKPVRDFVAQNAAYWVNEFHLDGLRLDATHAMIDESHEHIVTQLTRTARAAAGSRPILVYSEDERNRCYQVLPPEQNGFGIDCIWNDDFHHACRVAATGYREGYYNDYGGSPQELISAIRLNHLYQGQWNARQGAKRGHSSWQFAAARFVHFLQNHDQVANSVSSLRTHTMTTPGRHRALTALLLLGPQTPLLFMGQEFAASAPFCYFADHEPELAALVRTGRTNFMCQFPRVVSFGNGSTLADPSDETTFLRSKLEWSEVERNPEVLALHRDLIRLRRTDPVMARQDKSAIEGSVIGPEALALRWFEDRGDDRLLLVNLGRDFDWRPLSEPLAAAPHERQWRLAWSSEDPRYGGTGTPTFDEKRWRVPGHTALLLAAAAG
jgi:maltooligosyltrehalose trehalohydrolase